MVINNGLNKTKWILPTLALGAMLCACFESGKDVAGTSEESEGIVALEGKMTSPPKWRLPDEMMRCPARGHRL